MEMTYKRHFLRLVEGEIRRHVCTDICIHRLCDDKFWDHIYNMLPPIDRTRTTKPEDNYVLGQYSMHYTMKR